MQLNKKLYVYLFVVILAIVAITSVTGMQIENNARILDYFNEKNIKIENLAKAKLSINGLSCSSCIIEIKEGLSKVRGVQDVIVDLSNNTCDVFYDSTVVKNPQLLADKVTEVGYPASIAVIYNSKELKKEETIAAKKSKLYIASVGNVDISRSDFDLEYLVAEKKYEKLYGKGIMTSPRARDLKSNIQAQIVTRLVNEGILLQEINRAGFRLNESESSKVISNYLKQNNKTKQVVDKELTEAGYEPQYFYKKLADQALINKYIKEVVAKDATDFRKQSVVSNWFNNAKSISQVKYYDKELERLVLSSGASQGASCCTTN